MNITEVLQLIDERLIERDKKPLNTIQKAIFEGSWQGQSYQEIGNEYHRSETHIREEGAKLWKLLSDAFGEEIKKSNFRSTIERMKIKSSPNSLNVVNSNNNSQSESIYHDLTLAPQIIDFYDRENELATVSNWVFKQNTRLIAVLGLWGIGKTTLVKRFIDLNLEQFEVVIWKSLKFPKSLDLWLNDLLNTCQKEPKESTDNKIQQLLEVLSNHKCLIVLDDFQNLFAVGQMAGNYQSEYSSYQHFLKLIAEIQHQSHFILISQEKSAEMNYINQENSPIQCLELSGFEAIDFLKNKGLQDGERWFELIQLYEGNPLYLTDIAVLIKDVFDGKVNDFLAENSLVITKKMQSHLKQIFGRCSPLAQQIALELSKVAQPLSREELKNNLDLSASDLINGLQSLQQRYLIQREQNRFQLSSIFKAYIKSDRL
ncbi:MAG: NACHT domain-containing protein [Microcystis panniformis Mp_MB_F_20051200_S9]|uniref:NACHT domain-containing protein n=1 Tax=Microcystis panniformis Mp_MB_F_20051200_S9 TaxID=2486223 RepID=A0A552QBE5_9CHRO|nr:MAG: NACHT domain-containing protein [Microcystis panniformis Mp_MB_F_20080800_S26D]TRV48760.1 MAG: NACHT domain-containing protein [Microcystis panniformis Mp_GB_SS_20050300_S99]TRV55645.1 MAG: NACHT domain-containing protein [Microcystis panniformis Mp_GB_SS_20050300_S99D]TRV56406.1 MAG: NACHT domain-containing protein [Microcystis panniformis Mp_MB_F_20080800_S26]TRV60400.1 MAG: NACHT domain-containing protein [Microcystis panniformis Mp_MB_F_20051200_S9D]TRV66568.1 MAG: NACHT domain-con